MACSAAAMVSGVWARPAALMAGFPGGSLTKIRNVRMETTHRTKIRKKTLRMRYRVIGWRLRRGPHARREGPGSGPSQLLVRVLRCSLPSVGQRAQGEGVRPGGRVHVVAPA